MRIKIIILYLLYVLFMLSSFIFGIYVFIENDETEKINNILLQFSFLFLSLFFQKRIDLLIKNNKKNIL